MYTFVHCFDDYYYFALIYMYITELRVWFVLGALIVEFHNTHGGAVEVVIVFRYFILYLHNYDNIFFVRNISRELNVIYKPRILRK